ncbi:MAG: aminoacetone oxidase family FAD-binding enzyme [Acidimicrobiia bacterium]|nr:aminoacetone oxidase family FAD-binding enzyme [Acidimicrobiia bacterium]
MVVVIGAGAAGLVAATFARSTGQPVRLLERTSDGGRKILISGGGRCNILPSSLQPERFITDSPAHLMRGLLRSWPLTEQRTFFENEVGIPLALESDTGKLFPKSNRARDVRDGLVDLATRRGVEIQYDTTVNGLRRSPGEGWQIETSRGPLTATAVILATGGLSVPQTGSDGTGLRIAQDLGHGMHPFYPALTPLTGGMPGGADLAGISLPVRIRAKGDGRTRETAGGFLFTHRGYSGPSVLDISDMVTKTTSEVFLRVSWTDRTESQWRDEIAATTGRVASVVARHLPERLAEALCADAGLPPDRRGPELRREERLALIERLTAYALPLTGNEGYKRAEVTGGGVALTDIHSRTLESVRHPGLFMCGEMLDAFGPIGGYNFAWAWATGRLAGLAAGRMG